MRVFPNQNSSLIQASEAFKAAYGEKKNAYVRSKGPHPSAHQVSLDFKRQNYFSTVDKEIQTKTLDELDPNFETVLRAKINEFTGDEQLSHFIHLQGGQVLASNQFEQILGDIKQAFGERFAFLGGSRFSLSQFFWAGSELKHIAFSLQYDIKFYKDPQKDPAFQDYLVNPKNGSLVEISERQAEILHRTIEIFSSALNDHLGKPIQLDEKQLGEQMQLDQEHVDQVARLVEQHLDQQRGLLHVQKEQLLELANQFEQGQLTLSQFEEKRAHVEEQQLAERFQLEDRQSKEQHQLPQLQLKQKFQLTQYQLQQKSTSLESLAGLIALNLKQFEGADNTQISSLIHLLEENINTAILESLNLQKQRALDQMKDPDLKVVEKARENLVALEGLLAHGSFVPYISCADLIGIEKKWSPPQIKYPKDEVEYKKELDNWLNDRARQENDLLFIYSDGSWTVHEKQAGDEYRLKVISADSDLYKLLSEIDSVKKSRDYDFTKLADFLEKERLFQKTHPQPSAITQQDLIYHLNVPRHPTALLGQEREEWVSENKFLRALQKEREILDGLVTVIVDADIKSDLKKLFKNYLSAVAAINKEFSESKSMSTRMISILVDFLGHTMTDIQKKIATLPNSEKFKRSLDRLRVKSTQPYIERVIADIEKDGKKFSAGSVPQTESKNLVTLLRAKTARFYSKDDYVNSDVTAFLSEFSSQIENRKKALDLPEETVEKLKLTIKSILISLTIVGLFAVVAKAVYANVRNFKNKDKPEQTRISPYLFHTSLWSTANNAEKTAEKMLSKALPGVEEEKELAAEELILDHRVNPR